MSRTNEATLELTPGCGAAISSPKTLRKRLRLSRERFAGILGYSPRSLATWEKEGVISLNALRSLEEVRSVYEHSCRVVGTEEAARWLGAPNRELGGISPLEAIRLGRLAEVVRMLVLVEEGIPV